MQTILLIEPLPLIRHSICAFLAEGEPDYRVLGMDIPDPAGVCTQPEAVNLVIISAGVDQHWLEVIDWVEQRYQASAILMIVDVRNQPSLDALPPTVTCVSNEITPEVLRALVNLLLVGGTYDRLHPWLYRSTTTDSWQEPQDLCHSGESTEEFELLGLTPRQYEVLVLLSKGYPIKTVGRAMNISAATAKAHAEALYQRLDVNSRNAAVYKAILRGATLGWTMDKVRSMVDKHPGRRESAQAPWDATLRPGGQPSADDEEPDSERLRHSRTPHAA